MDKSFHPDAGGRKKNFSTVNIHVRKLCTFSRNILPYFLRCFFLCLHAQWQAQLVWKLFCYETLIWCENEWEFMLRNGFTWIFSWVIKWSERKFSIEKFLQEKLSWGFYSFCHLVDESLREGKTWWTEKENFRLINT